MKNKCVFLENKVPFFIMYWQTVSVCVYFCAHRSASAVVNVRLCKSTDGRNCYGFCILLALRCTCGRAYVVCINVSYVMEFLAWWVLKSKVFAQKSTVVKWYCCILWIDIVWSLQKLGIILESKVVQKLSLEKNVLYKKWSPKLIFLNDVFFWKSSVNFWPT